VVDLLNTTVTLNTAGESVNGRLMVITMSQVQVGRKPPPTAEFAA